MGSGGVVGTSVRCGRLNVDAGSGSVRLERVASSDVNVETGSGGIRSNFAIKTTHIARNERRGTIGDGSARIRIESGSGTVRLRKSAN